MRGLLLAAACVGAVAVGGCTLEAEEFPVTITGTVREGGVPVEGAYVEIYNAAINGLPELQGETRTAADGTFTLTTQEVEIRCYLVFVTVEVRDLDGSVLLEGRANADDCGNNVVTIDL